METRFEIFIQVLPENHIPVLRVMREIAGIGLKEAKELLTYLKANCPCVLMTGVEKNLAETITNRLINVNVVAQVQTSSISNPMLVCPKFDQRYQYHWLFGLQSIDK